MSKVQKVAVVGAGIGGLSAAIALIQRGFDVTIYEQADQLGEIGAGIQRITAVTGQEAVATVQRLSGVVDDLTMRFNCKPEEIGQRITALQEQIKKARGDV